MSSTPSVNSYQVGGQHYARGGEFQHWDWVEKNGMGYLEACATKYVTRWRRKNGLQDLEKALHYVAKLRELARPKKFRVLGLFTITLPGRRNRAHNNAIETYAYVEANQLTLPEGMICGLLQHWRDDRDLERAANAIQRLIDRQRELNPGGTA